MSPLWVLLIILVYGVKDLPDEPQFPHVVKFYAPWCPHCKKFKITYENLEDSFSSTKLQFFEADCDKKVKVCADHGIKKYPTVKVYLKKNKSLEYKSGGLDKSSVEKWLSTIVEKNNLTGAKSENLSPMEDVLNEIWNTYEALMGTHRVYVIIAVYALGLVHGLAAGLVCFGLCSCCL